MKRNLLFLFALMCTFTLFTGCSDDDKEDAWKQLFEKGSYAGENLVLTYSGAELSGKTIEVGTGEGKTLALKLKNILPGEAEATISGIQVDDLGGFSGVGTTSSGANMTCSGSIKEGILTVNLSDIKMSQAALGGLNGSWAMLDTIIAADESLSKFTSAPFRLSWPAINKDEKNAEYLSLSGSILGSHFLVELLSNVTFHEDGNITAKYSNKMPVDANTAQSWIMGKLFSSNPTNIEVTNNQWIDSPKNNLAFWYTKDKKLYIIPNIEMIMKQVGSKSTASSSDSSIKDILAILQELGMDITKIDMTLIMGWFTTGIPLNYTTNDGVLQVYVDKKMVEPFMPILISMLPQLQIKLDEIAASNPMIGLLPILLGVEKLTDFDKIWNNNTADFELGIGLKK